MYGMVYGDGVMLTCVCVCVCVCVRAHVRACVQTLEPLPTRQHMAELPDINWKSYMDSVEKVVRQHSSVYQRTRRKISNKEATTLTKMVCVYSGY